MDIKGVYRLIQPDMDKVEEKIRTVSHVEYPWQAELLAYTLNSGGKRLRPVLTLLVSKLFNCKQEPMLCMAAAVELLHTATLVHDDAIDKSDKRRGRDTVNKLWGNETAILLGDYMFARAGEFATDTGNVYVVKLFTRTLQTISSGELNQARNAFNINQTRDQYVRRIAAKTASLFCLSLESGAVLGGATRQQTDALVDYGYNMGVAFQIVDDILDFTSTEKEMGKPIGADLASGTLTLPAMLCMERYPENNPVRNLFENPKAQENVRKAIDIILNSSIIPDSYKAAESYIQKARENISILPDCQGKDALACIADYVIQRKK